MSKNEDRLREPPSSRFAAPEHLIEIHKAIEALRREPHIGTSGHRTKALYRHGPIECLIFLFEKGAALADHVVNGGSVAIQVIDGSLCVQTSTAEHSMTSGSLLLLAPGVSHSVTALQPTSMLLTISSDEPNQSSGE